MDTGGFFPAVKAHRLSPSREEVKNAWSYTSAPQYVFKL
jgi:hypothetical protein